MNPVVTVLSVFTALFAGGSIWGFAATFINRKADLKEQDARTSSTLEEQSRLFRLEVRQENVDMKKEIREMKEAFVPFFSVLDRLLPKMVNCLDEQEKSELRKHTDAVKLVI